MEAMKDIPEGGRKAVFRTVVAIIGDDIEEIVVGKCNGVITAVEQGSGGFGYDPVFLIQERNQTFAEMSLEDKNKISHRGIAVGKAVEVLKKYL